MREILNDSTGAKIAAVILGFGLAAIFRTACRGNNCVIVKSPDKEDLQRYYYKLEDECFKYTPYAVQCDDDKGQGQGQDKGKGK